MDRIEPVILHVGQSKEITIHVFDEIGLEILSYPVGSGPGTTAPQAVGISWSIEGVGFSFTQGSSQTGPTVSITGNPNLVMTYSGFQNNLGPTTPVAVAYGALVASVTVPQAISNPPSNVGEIGNYNAVGTGQFTFKVPVVVYDSSIARQQIPQSFSIITT